MIMRLLDLVVSKKFIGQALDGGSYYLRMEMPDGLYAWKLKGKFTLEEGNKMLADAEVDFLSMVEKWKAAMREISLKADVEEQPTLWLNDSGELKMTARCIATIEEGESIEQKVAQLRERMKQEEIYLRVSLHS